MGTKRIYHVTDGTSDHLVNASTKHGARSHVARNKYKVELASQHKLVELIAKGVKMQETAAAEEEVETNPLEFGGAVGTTGTSSVSANQTESKL